MVCIKAGPEIGAYTQSMRKTSAIIWQDTQHQLLFDILDDIKQPTADRKILLKLRDYTEFHFALEERYMEVLGFPDRQQHIESHNRFRVEVYRLLQETDEPDAAFREIIATFLTEWLTRHVFGVDKTLEAFILQSDIR